MPDKHLFTYALIVMLELTVTVTQLQNMPFSLFATFLHGAMLLNVELCPLKVFTHLPRAMFRHLSLTNVNSKEVLSLLKSRDVNSLHTCAAYLQSPSLDAALGP